MARHRLATIFHATRIGVILGILVLVALRIRWGLRELSSVPTAQLEAERTKRTAGELADRVANSLAVAECVLELVEEDPDTASELRDYARTAHTRLMDVNDDLKSLRHVNCAARRAAAA
jgi:hypothetical protein